MGRSLGQQIRAWSILKTQENLHHHLPGIPGLHRDTQKINKRNTESEKGGKVSLSGDKK